MTMIMMNHVNIEVLNPRPCNLGENLTFKARLQNTCVKNIHSDIVCAKDREAVLPK